MARPRRSQAIREQLLDEGLKAFLERGYHGTGIKEVLDRVDVPKGSFYNYFETKEAFGAEVIGHYADGFGKKLAAALDGAPDPVTGLRRFFNRLMKEFKAAGYVGGCLVANLGGEVEGSDVCRAALSGAWNGWRDGVEAALSEGQKQGLVRDDLPARELAELLVDSWEGAVIRMKVDRSLQPLRRVVSRLLDGYFRP